MQNRALILGINGQDGSYLADILVQAGYDVHGVVRRSSQPNLWRIAHLLDRVTIHQGDLLDFGSIHRVFWKTLPEEVYNEADQDHVGYSESTPSYSAAVTYGAVSNLLELVGQVKSPKVRFFQPLSATMFGYVPGPQDEQSPFNPQSPYAVAKLAAYYLCKHYREKYGVFVSTAIFYNHDSVRRQGDYLLHKICKAAVRIAHGDELSLSLTNQWMRVDIGCAKEYMAAAHKLLQLEYPTDLVIGSGAASSIYSLVKAAFFRTGISIDRFKNVPGDQICNLEADYSKARELIGFKPERNVFSIINELCDQYTLTMYGGK